VDLPDDVALAIAPLEPGYAGLLARAGGMLVADPRVRALWLAGSVGRGVADAGSDLDLVATVTSVDAFTDPSLWSVVDPVITLPIPGMAGCFAFTTRQGLRVDVVLETPADVAHTTYVQRVCVFDHDGLTLPSYDGAAEPGPDVERMQAIVTEFLRQTAIFPAAVVARGDWLLGQAAVRNYGVMLYDLFVESNQPVPLMGVKQWSSRLTPDQRSLLESLEPPRADHDSVIAAMRELRHIVRARGRSVLEASGGTWPTEVDEATDAYWRRHGLA
jgi:hypothetical protein